MPCVIHTPVITVAGRFRHKIISIKSPNLSTVWIILLLLLLNSWFSKMIVFPALLDAMIVTSPSCSG